MPMMAPRGEIARRPRPLDTGGRAAPRKGRTLVMMALIHPMKPIGRVIAVSFIVALITGRLPGASASPASPSGWAVLIENDWYAGRYADLPAGYVNSTRMLTLLTRRGWPADHILLVRDDLDPGLLPRALGWLAARVRAGDTAVLYVAGEYEFFARDLLWARAVHALWNQIPTSQRVLIVETCFAERLAAAVQGIPGIALPAVGRGEWDLWGTNRHGPLVQGGAFTYYLTQALAQQPPGSPLAFGAAFAEAVAKVQEYSRTVLFTFPAALDAFHAMGDYPERLTRFPNPHLIGGRSGASVPDQAATPWP